MMQLLPLNLLVTMRSLTPDKAAAVAREAYQNLKVALSLENIRANP
jgi:hypothetical protein